MLPPLSTNMGAPPSVGMSYQTTKKYDIAGELIKPNEAAEPGTLSKPLKVKSKHFIVTVDLYSTTFYSRLWPKLKSNFPGLFHGLNGLHNFHGLHRLHSLHDLHGQFGSMNTVFESSPLEDQTSQVLGNSTKNRKLPPVVTKKVTQMKKLSLSQRPTTI